MGGCYIYLTLVDRQLKVSRETCLGPLGSGVFQAPLSPLCKEGAGLRFSVSRRERGASAAPERSCGQPSLLLLSSSEAGDVMGVNSRPVTASQK